MTKPVTRKMAVDCLLWLIGQERSHGLVCAPEGGFRAFICYICGEAILPEQIIQFDHVHADVHGGGHTYKHIRPVHYDPCHKKKTKADVQAKAKGDRILGLTCNGPKKKIQSRGFQKAPEGHKHFGRRP